MNILNNYPNNYLFMNHFIGKFKVKKQNVIYLINFKELMKNSIHIQNGHVINQILTLKILIIYNHYNFIN